MKRLPRRRLVLIALLALATIAFAVSYSLRDTTPPQVYAEVPERAPAGRTLELLLSADEPVTYRWRYGEAAGEVVAQSTTLAFEVVPGDGVLELSATDGAGNESRYAYPVYGVAAPAPQVALPERLIPGEPFSVRVSWPDAEARVASVLVQVKGQPKKVIMQADGVAAIAGVPLGAEVGRWPIRVALTDEYGRTVSETRELEVLEYPQPVEDLVIPSSVLARATPEGEALEAELMAAAYARAEETPEPLWLEPFALPLEGRDTSSFGSPRRYAPGGNVSYHYGADLAAPTGTPIRATNRGRVLVADFYPIKGGLVVIDHGAGVYSLYLHQSKVVARVGQQVERGEVIGEVGSTGLSTGPHLHWEMRVFGEASNPLSWVDKLLP